MVIQCTLRFFGTNNVGSFLLRDPSSVCGTGIVVVAVVPHLTDAGRDTRSDRFDGGDTFTGLSVQNALAGCIALDDEVDVFRPLWREVAADAIGTLKKSISTGRLPFRSLFIGNDGGPVVVVVCADGGVGYTVRELLPFDDDAPTKVTSSESESSSSLRLRRRGRSATVPLTGLAEIEAPPEGPAASRIWARRP